MEGGIYSFGCEWKGQVQISAGGGESGQAMRLYRLYPLTQMSDIFSPVMKASSSRTTSSVFQIITRSSKLDNSTAMTWGAGRGIDKITSNATRQTNNKRKQKQTKSYRLTTHSSHTCPYLPPHKYVTGLFPCEVIIIFQNYFVSIPYYHPELISGR